MGSKDNAVYMEQAIIDNNAVIEYTKGCSYEEFISDVKTIDATMFRL